MVRVRTDLTVMLTDLELAHRLLCRMREGDPWEGETHAALLMLTEDAIESGRSLAEHLRRLNGGLAHAGALPVAVGE